MAWSDAARRAAAEARKRRKRPGSKDFYGIRPVSKAVSGRFEYDPKTKTWVKPSQSLVSHQKPKDQPWFVASQKESKRRITSMRRKGIRLGTKAEPWKYGR